MTLLTDLAVRRAKPASKPYTMKDGAGLYLNVKPNGTKHWLFRFYWNGVQKRISFGIYPAVDLRTVRSLRQQAHDLLVQGIDPRSCRPGDLSRHDGIQVPEKVTGTLFSVYAERWMAFKFRRLGKGLPNSRQSTRSQIERYMHMDMLPVLGKLFMEEITRADLLKVQRKIETRQAYSIAEKVRSWLNELFRYAMAEGLIESNPASDMDVVAHPKNPTLHHPFLRMDELPAFLVTLRNYQGARQTQLGIRLLLLTGVRTGELRLAKPEDFDLEKGLWLVPAEHVKQLQRRVRSSSEKIPPYTVPLSQQAVDTVKELLRYRFPRQTYLLCHRTDPRLMTSENTLNYGLRRMGYKDRLTGHGIRATISTALNELGYQREWIEAQLSHSDKDQIRLAYNHAQYVEQRRQMMQDWANMLDGWEKAGQQTSQEVSHA